jgi:16S rRNA U1498 N3-methylase RsmE
MKIEITTEQFNLIQNEIIRLEEGDLVQSRIENDTWWRIAIQDKIEILKEILKSEEIDLDKLN